jgi:hypothetical protein
MFNEEQGFFTQSGAAAALIRDIMSRRAALDAPCMKPTGGFGGYRDYAAGRKSIG